MPHNKRKVRGSTSAMIITARCDYCDKCFINTTIKDEKRAEQFRFRLCLNHLMREHSLTRQESLDIMYNRSDEGSREQRPYRIISYNDGSGACNHHLRYCCPVQFL